jgi:hypothetical protein
MTIPLNAAPVHLKGPDRRSFIGGSDARIIMGTDEAALLRPWREKRGDSYFRLRCFRKRTPSSSPLSPMNSTPAASSARCNFARASSETRGPVPASVRRERRAPAPVRRGPTSGPHRGGADRRHELVQCLGGILRRL